MTSLGERPNAGMQPGRMRSANGRQSEIVLCSEKADFKLGGKIRHFEGRESTAISVRGEESCESVL